MLEWEDCIPDSPGAWRKIRLANVSSKLSGWEEDTNFLFFALRNWPKDMALVADGGYRAQSPRSRMRTRHEAFDALWKAIGTQRRRRARGAQSK